MTVNVGSLCQELKLKEKKANKLLLYFSTQDNQAIIKWEKGNWKFWNDKLYCEMVIQIQTLKSD